MDPRATRRSARLQDAQRPSWPAAQPMSLPQTASNSAFQSSSSLSSISSINTNLSQSPMMDQSQPRFDSAPLPSPMQTQQAHYFGSLQGQQTQQSQSEQQQIQYVGQKGGRGGAPETAPFLSNLNLVAEAAKRAQMACLMRDFGDVEL